MTDDEQLPEEEEEVEEDSPNLTRDELTKSEPETSTTTTTENVTYENGTAIYTDEKTKYKFKWCAETQKWKTMENEHYMWCEETQKWIPKVPLENEYYRWCANSNQWIPKIKQANGTETGDYGYDEKEKCQIYTDQDGAVFFWVRISNFQWLFHYFVLI